MLPHPVTASQSTSNWIAIPFSFLVIFSKAAKVYFEGFSLLHSGFTYSPDGVGRWSRQGRAIVEVRVRTSNLP